MNIWIKEIKPIEHDLQSNSNFPFLFEAIVKINSEKPKETIIAINHDGIRVIIKHFIKTV